MPGKAKPGKAKTHKGAKKRTKVTSTGKITMQKASSNHRLNPKHKRQKNLGGSRSVVSTGDSKRFKALL